MYGGTEKFQSDPHWRDYILFYEYFHGDNGAGLGASHQTGWTGLVAKTIQLFGLLDAKTCLGRWQEGRFSEGRAGSRGGKDVRTWPKHPVIYEINTWVWLGELSRKYQRVRESRDGAGRGVGCHRLSWLRRRLVHGRLGTKPCRHRHCECRTRVFLKISGGLFLTFRQRTTSGLPIVCDNTSSMNTSAVRRGLQQPVKLSQSAASVSSSILCRTMWPLTTPGSSNILNILSKGVPDDVDEMIRHPSSRSAGRYSPAARIPTSRHGLMCSSSTPFSRGSGRR